jgi:hypothetical protein
MITCGNVNMTAVQREQTNWNVCVRITCFRTNNLTLDAELVRLCDQPIKVVHSPKQRVHVAVAGHVIAKVLHGRAEERTDPHGVHSQRGDIVETLDDADEVADAVSAVVLERARVDLVDDSASPPLLVEHDAGSRRLSQCSTGYVLRARKLHHTRKRRRRPVHLPFANPSPQSGLFERQPTSENSHKNVF